MKRFVLFLLLIFHSTYLYAANHQPFLPPPGGWRIISDYGPRNGTTHWFHGGIDYAAPKGSDFHAVEDGIITMIKRSGSWYVKVKGYNAYWDYFHLFSDAEESTYTSQVTGKKWEWRTATLVDTANTEDMASEKVIILWAETPVVFSSIGGRWILNDDGTYIQDSSGNRIITRNTVTTDDFFAATGDSGTMDSNGNRHPHLHLQCETTGDSLNNGDINPLYHVTHPDGPLTATIESPTNNHTFTKAELSSNYQFR